jgi:recombination protein RecA
MEAAKKNETKAAKPADAKGNGKAGQDSAKTAALKAAVGQIERDFGQGSLMRLGDRAVVPVSTIPTGALSIDLALGVGGVPRGRIIEIFGPESSGKTTLVYEIIAQAQKMGGICAFIDTEHAIDPIYAKTIGVDIDELLVSQPDHGEQALEIADVLTRSGAVDVVAIDSVAALTPRAELEGAMGDQTVGLQARLMSQAMRKLTGNLNRANTICIFTNQIREKVGVMFGCFHYDARVVLADGSTEKIGKIVNQRMPVEVMSMNPDTGEISPKKIVEHYNNGETDEWLQFEVASGSGPGRRKFACTPNHRIFTPSGPKHAADIEVGEEVLASSKQYDLREDQLKLMLGSILGDGSLRFASEYNVHFRVGHGVKQRAYCEWKHEMLAPFANKMAPTGNGIGFDTIPMRQLAWLHEAVYAEDGSRTITDELVDQLDERAIAAWYCDDGNFSGHYARWGNGKAVIYNKSLSDADKERLADRCEALGMGRPTVTYRELLFSGDRARAFHEKIAPYVHPSMDYKLHPDFRGQFRWEPDTSDAHLNGTRLKSRTTMKAVPMKVLRKYPKPPTPRKRDRFDLQVEGNHTYLVDHVVVHNSPETQPGGRALKFYASQRIDIRRIETLKEGTEAVGNRVRAKIVKNKVAPPFRQAEFDIEYGQGISSEGCVLDLGIEHGIVQKSGAFFSYDGERLGQGRNNAKAFLRENPAMVAEIEGKIYGALGIERPGTPIAEVPPPPSENGAVADEVPPAPERKAA